MKYLALLKDSLRETIDSKVFFVTLAISVLAILGLASLKLEADPPDKGLQEIASRFADGMMVDLPVVGKIKISQERFAEYSIQDLENVSDASKPWAAEYHFIVEAKDAIPWGLRMTVFWEIMMAEELKERDAPTGRKTRARKFQEALKEEQERLQEREDIKKLDGNARNQRINFELTKFIQHWLDAEARSVTQEELETFIQQQLENQANWTVIKVTQLPPEKIKIQTKEAVPEGKDWKIVDKEAEGELNKFSIAVKSRSGTYRVWPHKASLFFGGLPLGDGNRPGKVVYNIEKYLVCSFGASAIMLLSCIITAFYIPNMLRKGTIDFLLVKPVSRLTLLFYKYIGGLTFMFLNSVVLIVGLWVVIGLRSAIWEPSFLLMVFVLTYQFALFYALSTLGAVLTRSPIVSILLCVVLWALLYAMGWFYWGVNLVRPTPGSGAESPLPTWVTTTVDTAHAALPHYGDLDELGAKQLYQALLDPSPAELQKLDKEYEHYHWGETLAVTSAYILVMLGLAYWRFATKDY
jgi:ABC-type transport system involved in multi-copper enzyme maturation permease subunit